MTAPNPIPFKAEGPQPLLRAIPEGEAYPVVALGPLQGAVEAVKGIALAPVAIPAQSALAVASLAVQGFANVETLNGPRALSLYCLTIAASGERKSACFGPLLEAVRDHEREAAIAQRGDMQSWQNAQALYKGERERILADAKKGKGEKRTAAEADLDALGSEPAAPPSPDRIVTEPTFEGLTRLYATGQPSLGIFSDEGGQFLGGHAMNSDNRQKTLTALNDLWQGNPIRRTRAGDGAYTLYERRLAVHLMAQPGVAHTFMADPLAADSGFLARFLICQPPSAIGTRLHRHMTPDSGALGAFSSRLRTILDTPMPMDADTRELQPRVLSQSEGARSLLIEFHDTIEKLQAPGGDLAHITGTASKAAEQAGRIAGVLTLWQDLDAPEVTARDMAHAITLAQFYLSEAARLAEAATVSVEIERAEKLRKWLLESWGQADIAQAEVIQSGPYALRDVKTAKPALALLEQYGWIVRLESGAVVRSSPRKDAWRIVRGLADVV
ncbi:YfjI family protein [Roseovarius sp. S1116L3]|uniref:YfjI family protein n=1 Tax=Roseovarius roseus TaxID=3342636 RepID=UPI00372B5F09